MLFANWFLSSIYVSIRFSEFNLLIMLVSKNKWFTCQQFSNFELKTSFINYPNFIEFSVRFGYQLAYFSSHWDTGRDRVWVLIWILSESPRAKKDSTILTWNTKAEITNNQRQMTDLNPCQVLKLFTRLPI